MLCAIKGMAHSQKGTEDVQVIAARTKVNIGAHLPRI
jgi:hypothetical protein